MLRNYLIGLTLIGTFINANAQFDERFYFPNKEVVFPDSLSIEEIPLLVETDTIYIQFLKPLVTSNKWTILYFHGAGGNSSTYLPSIVPLIQSGYEVFMVDFRGYGRSSGTPTHLNIEQDAYKVLDAVLSRSSHPIICYGASMGTQVATRLAWQRQEKVHALILDCPLSSFTDIAVHSSPEPSRAMIKQFVTSPYSAKTDIGNIKDMPILILHGANDQSIPLQQGQMVYNNAISIHKKWWIYDGDHLEAPILFTKEYLAQIKSLLND